MALRRLSIAFASEKFFFTKCSVPARSAASQNSFMAISSQNRPLTAGMASRGLTVRATPWRPRSTPLAARPSLAPGPLFPRFRMDPTRLGRFYAIATPEAPPQATDEEAPSPLTVPVVLTVRNMKCGGCSAAVKRMLLQQPGISGAAVNLLTETAVVQVAAEDAEEVAAAAATVVSSKGFPAELRSADEDDLNNTAAAINERKAQELKDS
jgi:copper chaperone CopZ